MKRYLSLLLAVVMLVSGLVFSPVTVSAATYNFLFPVNNGGKIAYYYGYSSSYGGNHTGIDIHSNGDDNIYAAESGTVANTANPCECISEGSRCPHYDTFGNYVKIKHSNGTYSYYGHLLHDSIKVSVGQTVTKGQVIATMGSSGYSTGKHLHFEVRLSDGSTKVNVNPTSNGGSVNYTYSGYTSSPTPSFNYTSISTGQYYLKHNATGKYMNVAYGIDENKQDVHLHEGFYSSEVMNIVSTSYGYKMRPECCTSRVINAWGNTPGNGSNVNIYDDEGHLTQSWKFQAVSGGYIIHNAYNTSLVLDNDNGNVCIKTYTGGSSQIWSLVPYHPTHSYDTYVYYWASHPHYKCYKCSCGEIKENRDEPTYIDSCASCRVGKTTVSSDKDVYYTGENVKLSWTAASNATHYNFYIMKKNSSGEYKEQIDWIREYKQTSYTIEGLSAGDYMIRMYSYDSKHWESDGSDWCHEMADQIYFSVKENEIEPEIIEIKMTGEEDFVEVEWSAVAGAQSYQFIAHNEKKSEEIPAGNKTKIEWDAYDFALNNVCVQVKAYDSSGRLIGDSNEQWYRIDDCEGSWWGDCGDVNYDGKVSVKDATSIQKYLAGMIEYSVAERQVANVNGDSAINVKDATVIQKYIAGIEVENNIGKYLSGGVVIYIVNKLEAYESDWVLASELPDGAEIVDEKWTYDLATRTTSGSSTAPTGYSQYKDPTWEWGSYGDWSEWSKTVYTESDSRQVESQYYAATTKTVWKYNRDVNSAGTLSTYSLGYYGNCQYITLDYKLSSMGTVDGHTRYGSYDGGYGSYLKNYWWNESQASEVVTPAYYMYRYRDRSKVYTYYYQMIESKESQTEIVPSDTITNVQKWVKYVVY